LELGNIDVEGSVKSEGSGQTGNDLGYQSVKVGVCWALNIERSAADVVDRFVVKHDGNVGVLEEGMGGEHGVVGLHDGGGDLGRWVGAESKLGLLAVVNGETLEEEGAETGAGATADGVEDHEALETGALVGELTEAVEREVDDLLANGVVATSVVVGCIFLAGDELLGVVELAVGAGADFIDYGGLEIKVDGARHVLAGAGLGEEGVEGVIATADGLVGRHLAIRLDAVLEAVELPAGVTDLATALADVD
jgi:hypothetical protein